MADGMCNFTLVREGAKNTLRGVPGIARPSASSGSPPTFGCVGLHPPPVHRPGGSDAFALDTFAPMYLT